MGVIDESSTRELRTTIHHNFRTLIKSFVRLRRISTLMKRDEFDTFLVCRLPNIRYLSILSRTFLMCTRTLSRLNPYRNSQEVTYRSWKRKPFHKGRRRTEVLRPYRIPHFHGSRICVYKNRCRDRGWGRKRKGQISNLLDGLKQNSCTVGEKGSYENTNLGPGIAVILKDRSKSSTLRDGSSRRPKVGTRLSTVWTRDIMKGLLIFGWDVSDVNDKMVYKFHDFNYVFVRR